MGKLTYKGLVPPDDPMFSSGPEMFSRPESRPSSMTSVRDTTGATPAQSSSVETEADGKELGALRIARYKHQNAQLRKKR
jgi:hypothetical protein